jgi:hypothetical protein
VDNELIRGRNNLIAFIKNRAITDAMDELQRRIDSVDWTIRLLCETSGLTNRNQLKDGTLPDRAQKVADELIAQRVMLMDLSDDVRLKLDALSDLYEAEEG